LKPPKVEVFFDVKSKIVEVFVDVKPYIEAFVDVKHSIEASNEWKPSGVFKLRDNQVNIAPLLFTKDR